MFGLRSVARAGARQSGALLRRPAARPTAAVAMRAFSAGGSAGGARESDTESRNALVQPSDMARRNAATVVVLLAIVYAIYWRSITAISQNDFGGLDKDGNPTEDRFNKTDEEDDK